MHDDKATSTEPVIRYTWGTDAGFYRLIPQVVAFPKNENELATLVKHAREMTLPVTFRAAGTSLSGQAITDSILIVIGEKWNKHRVLDEGKSIELEPGIRGGRVNAILRPFGRKFGPDPASLNACMVGGIVMNNASGMSCGTWANSDKLLESIRLILTDGTILDTGSEESIRTFKTTHQEIIDGIRKIRDDIRADQELTERIRYKYAIKTVMGLNLRPFVEYEDEIEILTHLIAGSEGTLGAVSLVRMKTLPEAPLQASALVYFDTMREANNVAVTLKKLNVSAAELLDSRSLASVNDEKGIGKAALLIKIEAFTEEELQGSIDKTEKALAEYRTAYPFRFTSDPKECAGFWAIRSGIFPTVGSMRKLGTTCMIEDIAFHIEDLPDAIDEVSALLDNHGYDDSCIYGHVLEGNVHFIINQKLDSEQEIARYKAMLNDIVTLVTDKYDGSLKAEHGTGRNMAPFVEHEWGTKAYNYMKRVKELLDPENILNRGVIFNDDKECSYKSFKSLPVISPKAGASPEAEAAFAKANKCIECGFCEPNCMSYGFTLSARTRITLLRKLEELRSTGADPDFLESLEKKFKYYADETCAGDGLCSTSCPMGINTADITHEVRRKNPGSLAWNTGDFAAKHLSGVKSMLRGTLDLAYTGRSIVGEPCMSFLGKALHGAGLPLWTESLPKSFKLKNIESQASDLKVVYFPSCINQTMGLDRASKGMRPLVEEMKSLLEKAGYEVIFPENRESLCCGTIWESKGMADIAERKVRELEEALYKASCGGRYPVVCDQSPSLHRMKQCITKVKLYDSAEFIWEFLREKLEFHQINEPIALHVTCSTKHMKLDKMIYDLARLCSPDVLIPEGVGCCGFAGDKGMMTPELNAHGLRHLREQVQAKGIRTGYSNSRTCEIGLQTNSGIPYRSIVYLVNACTTKK